MGLNMNSGERRRFRARLFEAQDGVCPYCDERLPSPGDNVDQHHADYPTIDHVWSRSRTRRTSPVGNALLVHRGCNEDKADRRASISQITALHAVNRRLAEMYAEALRSADRSEPETSGQETPQAA